MDYAAARASAASKLRANGKLVTLRDPGGSYDPVTRITTPGTPADYSTYALEPGYEQSERDGTLIQANDRKFLVAALDNQEMELPLPTTAYELYVGDVATGTRLRIVSVKPFEPGDVAIYYEVQCRG